MSTTGYLPRLADARLAALLDDLPAVLVTGPRAAGKTTSARRLAADTLRLDDPAVAAAVAANPDAALRRAREPVLLDEWQEVPDVLGAVKRAVDDDPRAGRYLLTGSVEADLTQRVWPGTGRIVRLVLHGLTEREIAGAADAPGLLPAVIDGDLDQIQLPSDVPDIDGYVALALRSGFPEAALRLRPAARDAWLDAYLEHVVFRDVMAAREVRDPVRLRRYLEVLGLSTAGLPAGVTLYQATMRLPSCATVTCSAASSTPSSRPSCAPRSPCCNLGPGCTTCARNRLAMSWTWSSTWVAAVLSALRSRPLPHRTRDAQHLVWLRAQLGERFVRGILFHTGPQPFALGERIWALPICALWSKVR